MNQKNSYYFAKYLERKDAIYYALKNYTTMRKDISEFKFDQVKTRKIFYALVPLKKLNRPLRRLYLIM